jgi:Rrf2 family iron-sulfur cluster assembly transcriptional regulator
MDLARSYDQGPVPVSEISKRQGISVKYVEQLIRPLKKAGYIDSTRGSKGGHFLAIKPDDIRIGRIVRLLETHSELAACIASPEECDRSDDCKVRLVWTEATQSLYRYLDSITINDLIDDSVDFPCEREVSPGSGI